MSDTDYNPDEEEDLEDEDVEEEEEERKPLIRTWRLYVNDRKPPIYESDEPFLTKNDATIQRFINLAKEGKKVRYVHMHDGERQPVCLVLKKSVEEYFMIEWQGLRDEKGLIWGSHVMNITVRNMASHVAKYAGIIEFAVLDMGYGWNGVPLNKHCYGEYVKLADAEQVEIEDAPDEEKEDEPADPPPDEPKQEEPRQEASEGEVFEIKKVGSLGI